MRIEDLLNFDQKNPRRPRPQSSTQKGEMYGRAFVILRDGRNWSGYFQDDHATAYHADRKRDLVEHMSADAWEWSKAQGGAE